MRYSVLVRQQLKARLEHLGWSQRHLAREIGVTPQTLNDLLTGKRDLLGDTLEAALRVLQLQPRLMPLETDLQAVQDRARLYAIRLFPQAGSVKQEGFATSVGWLCTGNPKGLLRTVRALAVQDQLAPVLSFEEAVTAALPLVFGPLGAVHREVAKQIPEGDDRWDAQAIAVWQLEDPQTLGQ